METSRNNRHMVEFLFVICLFCVFAGTALVVVLFGANTYRSVAAKMDENYSIRTSLSYITEKIHQSEADENGGAVISSVGGHTALALKSKLQKVSYTTYIYESKGSICELLIRSDRKPDINEGKNIISVADFHIYKKGKNIIGLSATDKTGHTITTYIRQDSISVS